MNEATYLYAVARDELPVSEGVAGAPVRTIVRGDLVAYVSTVPLAEFGEEPLRRSLEDMDWLAETARAHHRVVDTVAAGTTTAPVRLVTVYAGDAQVADLLERREGDFLEVLERVTGRREWGVKAYAVPATTSTPTPSTGRSPDLSTGRSSASSTGRRSPDLSAGRSRGRSPDLFTDQSTDPSTDRSTGPSTGPFTGAEPFAGGPAAGVGAGEGHAGRSEGRAGRPEEHAGRSERQAGRPEEQAERSEGHYARTEGKAARSAEEHSVRPGTAYLHRRRASLRGREQARRQALQRADHIHRALIAVAAAGLRHRAQDPRLSGRHDPMLLNGAYLVDQDRDAEFAALADTLGGDGVEIRLTGPWAPYSFTVMETT